MQLIINDYSLCGQFESVEDDFTEYFKTTMKPVMDMLSEKKVPLLKKSDFYSRSITRNQTVMDVLHRTNDPIVTFWKSYIVQMAYSEPFWDSDIKTREDIEYQYPETEMSPNCFTEAMERGIPLFSFPHQKYGPSVILCSRDGEKYELENICEQKEFLRIYLKRHMQDIRYVMERYPFSARFTVEFFVQRGKCHSEEALFENSLSYDDYIKMIDDMPNLWDNLVSGQKTSLWDSFGDGLFEYRCNVSGGRIFRMLFAMEGKKFCFLSGFIKKTQRTPSHELDKGKALLKEWKNYGK